MLFASEGVTPSNTHNSWTLAVFTFTTALDFLRLSLQSPSNVSGFAFGFVLFALWQGGTAAFEFNVWGPAAPCTGEEKCWGDRPALAVEL